MNIMNTAKNDLSFYYVSDYDVKNFGNAIADMATANEHDKLVMLADVINSIANAYDELKKEKTTLFNENFNLKKEVDRMKAQYEPETTDANKSAV